MPQRLARLRIAAGLTQGELAERLTDVAGAGTVGGWESTEGKRPKLDTLIELSDLYKVDLYWLVTGRGPEKRVSEVEAAARLEAIQRLADPSVAHDQALLALGAYATDLLRRLGRLP